MSYCPYCGKELQEQEVCNCQEEETIQNEEICKVQTDFKKTIASAIIYPLLFIILSIFLYSIGETSIIGLILNLVMCIGAGALFIIGGFYLIVIPLPIVTYYRVGCGKPYLKLWAKIVLPIIIFILLFGTIGIAFLFR